MLNPDYRPRVLEGGAVVRLGMAGHWNGVVLGAARG
jgi:hypothetical protein